MPHKDSIEFSALALSSHKIVNEAHLEVETNKRLNELRVFHLETYNHSVRVADASVWIGHKTNLLDTHEREIELASAALLHDIGKLAIPHYIIDSKERLASQERITLDMHPINGFHMLGGFSDAVRAAAIGHHEYGLRPYPRPHPRIDDSWPCLATQIVSAADTIDALLHHRSYKMPIPLAAAIGIFRKEYRGEERFSVAAIHYAEEYISSVGLIRNSGPQVRLI